MARKSGLGRGLDSLIPSGEVPTESGVTPVQIDQVIPNPRQPRSKIDAELLQELAASIREHGLLQPIIVSYDGLTDQYVLIAGERRWLAAKLANLEKIPAIVREASDLERLELALIENVQRADLAPLESAEAYRQLSDDFNLTHDEIARRVSKSRAAVTNTLRLLNLPLLLRQALADNQISEGHARALLGLSDDQQQIAIFKIVIKRNLSVRQTEQLVQKMNAVKQPRVKTPDHFPEITDLESRLEQRFSTRVTMQKHKQGGSISIYYYSDEELDHVIALLLNE